MQYLEPLELYKTTKPYLINIPADVLPPGMASNESYTEYSRIVIQDIRGREDAFSLDQNGFAVYQQAHPQLRKTFPASTVDRLRPNFLATVLSYDDFANRSMVKEKYRRASEVFLRHLLGAESVHTFTHEVRRRHQSFPAKPRGDDGSPQPIQGVHVGKLGLCASIPCMCIRGLI